MISNNEAPPEGDELELALGEFRRMPVPEQPNHEDLLARLASLAASRGAARPAGRRGFPRRPRAFAATAVAAAVLLGCVLLTARSPMAFADVARAIERYKLVRHKLTQIIDLIPVAEGGKVKTARPWPSGNTQGVSVSTQGVSVSTAYQDLRARRFRTEFRNPRTWLVFLDVKDYTKGRWLMTQPELKEATVITVEGSDVRLLFDFVREFAEKPGVTAEEMTLAGVRAVRYRLSEDRRETAIWVDGKTRLPLRVECVDLNPAPDIRQNKFIWSEFEWDPEVADPNRLFSTDPPEGFAVTRRPDPRGQK